MSQADWQRRALADPEGFWRARAEALPWLEFPRQMLDRDANGAWRWFRGGLTNSCWLALDRHIAAGRGEQTALIYDSPATGRQAKYSYAELRDWTAQVAGGLKALGVAKGDRVVIYMPMLPEAAVAMLACARIGAVHSVVFGGFAAPELASRIDDAQPKAVLSASCGIEFARVVEYKPLLDEAIRLARHQVPHCVILQRPEAQAALVSGRDLDWAEWQAASAPADWVPVPATDPLYILYTSGTTGKPKGVLRDNGGHAVALHWSMQAIYGADAGDVFWAASDLGWVVGHSYILYGPLLRGCATVLYEGKPVRTPDAGAFWRVIEEHRVKVFFTAPTAFRAIRKEDPDCRLKAGRDLSCLRYQFVAGERLDPPTYHWLRKHLGIPVIDHWWQTETGWPICANLMGLEPREGRPGSSGRPVPGYDLRILGEDGRELPPGEEGALVLKEPLPPGAFPSLWQDHERFLEAYWSKFPGHYLTGDNGFQDEDGWVCIMGRADDLINVAGHRLSTGALEEAVAGHPAVAECAVVGMADADRGQVPLGLVVLKDGLNLPAKALQAELAQRVRRALGAFANFKRVLQVKRLPKTRSGKILRQALRKAVDGEPCAIPSTIDDPAIMEEIQAVLEAERVGRAAPGTESAG